jgi:hypothetical protein
MGLDCQISMRSLIPRVNRGQGARVKGTVLQEHGRLMDMAKGYVIESGCSHRLRIDGNMVPVSAMGKKDMKILVFSWAETVIAVFPDLVRVIRKPIHLA